MAVANSTTQIIIPGLDKLIQDNVDAVLATNQTIDDIDTNLQVSGDITSLTNAVTAVSNTVPILPVKEAYPTFAVYSNRDNNPYWNTYDSNMRGIDAGLFHTDADMWSPWTGNNYTNGGIGSSSWTSYWVAATPFHQADTHWFQRINSGHGTYGATNPDAMDSWMPFWGVVIGKEGVRQKLSLYLNGTTMRVMPRGQMNGWLESLNVSSSTYSTWHGGTNTTYGMIGYNDRTRQLVALEAKDGSNNYRMHIWTHTGSTRSLNSDNYDAGTLHYFLSEAKAGASSTDGQAYYEYRDFQWQANSSQNYNESRYRMRVIPGDNGIIGMVRMVPSNVTHYATYQPYSSTLTTSFNTIGLTTSYGIDNGNKYGMRHQITWDNNWVAAYSAYYYYGSGMNVHFVDVRDPRNYFIAQNGSGSWGCQLVPYQKDKFLFNESQNSDNSNYGIRLYVVEPEAAKNGRTPTGTITNGGTLSLQNQVQWGIFDTRYSSTNYPVLMSPSHWRVAL